MATTCDRNNDHPLLQALQNRHQAAKAPIAGDEHEDSAPIDHANGLCDNSVVHVERMTELDAIPHQFKFPNEPKGQTIVNRYNAANRIPP